MADELDDGLLLDDNLVAYSGDEAGSDAEGDLKKEAAAPPKSDATEAKKRKRKAARQKAGQSVAQQPSDRQADFLVAQQRKTYPKLSALEMQEMQVPATSLAETYAFTKERTLDHLAEFLREYALRTPDDLQSAKPWMTEKGAPYILVVSGNAQRAADIARPLRTLLPSDDARPAKRRKGASDDKGGAGVAKLFARHFKVDEQVAHLAEHPAPLAVGTPHRIQQLLERSALRTEHLAAVVVDHSWTDAKMRTIFDTPETHDALVALLSEGALRDAFRRKEPCKLVLY